MPEYDNTNRGILFRETKKKSDKAPDYTGKIDVNGHEFRLAGWIKDGRNNTKFLSLSLSEPQEKKQEASQASGGDDFLDNDNEW